MRISDWSSDVCSSDLHGGGVHRVDPDPGVQQWSRGDRAGDRAADAGGCTTSRDRARHRTGDHGRAGAGGQCRNDGSCGVGAGAGGCTGGGPHRADRLSRGQVRPARIARCGTHTRRDAGRRDRCARQLPECPRASGATDRSCAQWGKSVMKSFYLAGAASLALLLAARGGKDAGNEAAANGAAGNEAAAGAEKGGAEGGHADEGVVTLGRSEEHTSELQSLMRIAYAVFCMKKQKHNRYHKTTSRSHTIMRHSSASIPPQSHTLHMHSYKTNDSQHNTPTDL